MDSRPKGVRSGMFGIIPKTSERMDELIDQLPHKPRKPKFGEWQPIESAPKDGTPFLAQHDECVFKAFYKKNTVHGAKQAETLQVMTRPARYSAAGTWFVPTVWMPAPPGE